MTADVFDGLGGDDARVLRVSVPLPNGPIPFETGLRALGGVAEYMERFGVTREKLAHCLGASGVAIRRLFSHDGKTPNEAHDDLIRKVNAWIEEDFRERMGNDRPSGFVHTAIYMPMVGIARNVKAARMIGVVVGPAGLGKTTCIDQIAFEIPGTIVMSIDYDSRSGSGFLLKLDNAIQRKRRGLLRVRLDRVTERLRDSGRLLVVDQAHELSDTALKIILDLHNVCELPIMLVGTVDLNRRLLDDEDPEFGQLSSRIGIRLDLRTIIRPMQGGRARQWISAAELRKMFSGCKLKLHPDATRMIARIANFGVGHLRRVKHVLRLAEAIAGRDRSNKGPRNHRGTRRAGLRAGPGRA